MAGEGLFFAGTVLKNNRDLIEEDVVREELAIKKEQLELQKQDAANKRKDARNKGQKANLQDYSLDGINPLFVPDFQSNVGGYQDFANNNAMSIFDGDTGLRNEQSAQERDLSALSNNYISLSSDITSLDSLVNNNKGGQLKLAENGDYLYKYNMSMIQEATDGGMSMSEALELYPIDAQSMINKTEWEDPTKALFDADDSNDNRKVVSNDGEYNYTEIEPQKKADTQVFITNSLKVNSQGFHNDTNYKRLYDTKLLTLEGNEMTAKEAFFLESYIDPETGQVGGITGSDSLLEMLDPESERFDKDISNAYAEYLGKKISEEGYENKGRKQGGKFIKPTTKEDKDNPALSQDKIDFFMSDSEETEFYGLSELKVSPNFGEDITDAGIVVSLTKSSPIKEQGGDKLQEFYDLLSVANSEGTDAPAQGKVSWIGMTVSGKTVARVEFSGQSFLIDLADISSEQQEVKSGSTTALDLFKLAEGGSNSNSNGNKEKVSW